MIDLVSKNENIEGIKTPFDIMSSFFIDDLSPYAIKTVSMLSSHYQKILSFKSYKHDDSHLKFAEKLISLIKLILHNVTKVKDDEVDPIEEINKATEANTEQEVTRETHPDLLWVKPPE
jgi:hypothetical protein